MPRHHSIKPEDQPATRGEFLTLIDTVAAVVSALEARIIALEGASVRASDSGESVENPGIVSSSARSNGDSNASDSDSNATVEEPVT